MKASRLHSGEVIAAISGIVLLVVMFLGWYRFSEGCIGTATSVGGGPFRAGPTACFQHQLDAWTAFSVTDVFLLLAAAAGIGTALIAAANTKTDAPITFEVGAVVVGLLAALLVLYRLLDPPAGLDRQYGVYIGTVACLGVLYGSWRALRVE